MRVSKHNFISDWPMILEAYIDTKKKQKTLNKNAGDIVCVCVTQMLKAKSARILYGF